MLTVRIALALVLLSCIAAPMAMAQDLELVSPDAATINRLLRSSCYCIRCTNAELEQLVTARCKFVRWGAYPWINAHATADPNPGFPNELNSEITRFQSFAAAYKAAVPGGTVEFALPEIVPGGVENVVIEDDLLGPLSTLGLVADLTPQFRFDFEKVIQGLHGSHFWSEDGERNGVPSLVTAHGRLWAAYLAARAMRAGADSIFFASANLRVDSTANLAAMVRKIRRLRNTLQRDAPPLLFGTDTTDEIAQSSPATDLKLFIDYVKVSVDIDSYRMVNGQRVVNRVGASPVPCQLVGGGRDGELLPLPPAGHMCMIAINVPRRPNRPLARQLSSFNSSNPYGLRVLMELDGSERCFDEADPKKRVWYYKPDPAGGYRSNCYQEVRHGLARTLFFLSQPAPARSAFIRYMWELAGSLSRQKPYGVFYPLPIRVDQNEMKFVLEKAGCSPACGPACEEKPYARPTQVALIPGCPSTKYPDGRFCAVGERFYFARDCWPDFDTIQTILPR